MSFTVKRIDRPLPQESFVRDFGPFETYKQAHEFLMGEMRTPPYKFDTEIVQTEGET